MDWLTFISKLVEVLAWPACLVIFGIILREPLRRLLPALSLKYKDVEIRFEQEAKSIQQALPDPKIPMLTGRPATKLQRTMEPFRSTAEQILVTSPKAAIIQAWADLEVTARIAVGELLMDKGGYDPDDLRELLVKHSFLSDKNSLIWDRLKALRNAALHIPEFDISQEAAEAYVHSAYNMAARISGDI